MTELRQEIAAKIKDAYYSARDNGGTMHTAADDAVDAVLRVLAEHSDTEQVRCSTCADRGWYFANGEEYDCGRCPAGEAYAAPPDEHSDTEQVRERLRRALMSRFGVFLDDPTEGSPLWELAVDELMAVVAPILAALDGSKAAHSADYAHFDEQIGQLQAERDFARAQHADEKAIANAALAAAAQEQKRAEKAEAEAQEILTEAKRLANSEAAARRQLDQMRGEVRRMHIDGGGDPAIKPWVGSLLAILVAAPPDQAGGA
jgi:hypothetical protein